MSYNNLPDEVNKERGIGFLSNLRNMLGLKANVSPERCDEKKNRQRSQAVEQVMNAIVF